MIKFFMKYRIVIIIIILLIIVAGIVVSLKAFLYPDDLDSVYGNRLNGIDEVAISNDRLEALETKYSEYEAIDSFSVEIQGKIIDIIINANEYATISEIKPVCLEILDEFNEAEILFYDFQFFIDNKNLNYILIGYKNKLAEEPVYTEVSEVIKDEEEN